MTPKAILFDFDGVVIDSEWVGNCFIAAELTAAGHPTRPEDAIDNFMGLAGQSFDYVVTVCDRAKETCPLWPGC